MLAEMDAAGVDRAVIVPPTWVGEGNESGIEAAEKYSDRFAVMGRFDVNAADAKTRLRQWLGRPNMLGIRLTFGHLPRTEQLDDGSLDWFWADCERLGIPLMLNLPGLVEKAHSIAKRHPDLTVIIDHMGVAHGRGAAVFAGLETVLALAALPKTYVKVSCVPNYSAEAYPYRDIQPFLRQIVESFGARRLLWGADITRLTSTYQECVDLFRKGLDFLSEDDRTWILGGTLAQALNWPEERA
jgi:predicted TIM-barrel fold metal-dependent hydrolase